MKDCALPDFVLPGSLGAICNTKVLGGVMIDWLLRHGPTVLIFAGGAYTAFAAFKAERLASGEREKRRVGPWPRRILFGAIVAGVGALWAGLQQDRLFDYLSGGDSYGLFTPIPVTTKSLQFVFMQQGNAPLYDVLADAVDVTKRRKLSSERGLSSEDLRSKTRLTVVETEQLWELNRETTTTLNIGNVGPGAVRVAWESPVPESDDQRYDFAIWARNGLINEVLLMHRNSFGWTWAWRVERTSPGMNKGKSQKLDEQVMPNFPPEKLIWN
jgi:hypothetical protein